VTTSFESELTASEVEILIQNEGIFETYLEATFLINSASGFTNIQVDNVTTGKTCNVTGTFIAGDYITFNGNVTKNTNGTLTGKNVTQNGTVLYHSGIIPDLEVGNNIIRYTLTSISHSVNITTNTRLKY
jgi:hypothetical protein